MVLHFDQRVHLPCSWLGPFVDDPHSLYIKNTRRINLSVYRPTVGNSSKSVSRWSTCRRCLYPCAFQVDLWIVRRLSARRRHACEVTLRCNIAVFQKWLSLCNIRDRNAIKLTCKTNKKLNHTRPVFQPLYSLHYFSFLLYNESIFIHHNGRQKQKKTSKEGKIT